MDLSSVVAVTPRLSEPPQITQDGLLRLIGSFPADERVVNFKLLFQQIEGRWRLFAIAVDVAAPSTAAPGPPPKPPARQFRPSLPE